MTKTKVFRGTEVFTLVEYTAQETEVEFGYNFAEEVPGAVKELAIEESDGTLIAYEMEDGTCQLHISGRGRGGYGTVTKNEAIDALIEDAKW